MQYKTTTRRKLLTNKYLYLQSIKKQKIEKTLCKKEKLRTIQSTTREKTNLVNV